MIRAVTILQIVSSIDSSPEILAQVQEVIIPVIRYTLESKVLGTWLGYEPRKPCLSTNDY